MDPTTLPSLAIDFGTAYTKVAIFDAGLGKARTVAFGTNKQSAIPSVFYVPKEGQGSILVGYDAQHRAKDDLGGLVVELKKELHKSGKIRLGLGRAPVDRGELAGRLFKYIRERCEADKILGGRITTCSIAVPPTFAEFDREAIRRAAALGGFSEIILIEESVASAHAWSTEGGHDKVDQLIVCDMGGAATRFTLVQRIDGEFRTAEKVLPVNMEIGDDADISENLNRAAERARRFVEECAKSGVNKLSVLLVGGSPSLPDLKKKIEAFKIGPVHIAKDPGFAVALGTAMPKGFGALRARIQADVAEIRRKMDHDLIDLDQVLQRLSPSRGADWKHAAGLGWPEGKWLVAECLFYGIPGWGLDLPLAALFFFHAAESGFVLAQIGLATCYQEGKGTHRDPGKSLELLKTAADGGDLGALLELGYRYTQGNRQDQVKGFKILRDNAERDPRSHLMLGVCYKAGNGCQMDEHEAQRQFGLSLEALRKPAMEGGKTAQFLLGLTHLNGLGTEANPQLAFDWFSKSAQQGCSFSQKELGNCYLNGIGVEANPRKGVEYLRLAAEQGESSAQVNLGLCLLFGTGGTTDPTEAYDWLRKSAELGDAQGQYHFGFHLINGIAGKRDVKRGFDWIKLSAEQENSDAESAMGDCFLNGIGVQADPQTAVAWYRKSADQNCLAGICNLGWCYYRGMGIGQDSAKAIALFRKAAESDDVSSMYGLGVALRNSVTSVGHNIEAVDWLRRAVEHDHPGALFEFGYCYLTGDGIIKDCNAGITYIRQAAEIGFPEAQSFIGTCCLYGNYVSKNFTEAVNWFRKAAEQGDYNGQIGLGKCYLYGCGVPRDIPTAAKWLKPAADVGYPEALTNLGECYESGLL